MSRVRFRNQATPILLALLTALLIPALCWTQRARDAFRLPSEPAQDRTVLLAWQELVLSNPAGDTVQRLATRATEQGDWREAMGSLDAVGLLDFRRVIVGRDEQRTVAKLAVFDAASAALLQVPCDPAVAYAASPPESDRPLRIDDLSVMVHPLPPSLAGALLIRSQGVELLRCEAELPAGAFVLLQARTTADLQARIVAADGRSGAAFGSGSRTQSRIVDLRTELETRLGYRAGWAGAAMVVVLVAGWLAAATLLLIDHLRRREEFRIRIMLGSSITRFMRQGLGQLLAALVLGGLAGGGLCLLLELGDSVGHAAPAMLGWVVGVLVIGLLLSLRSARQAIRDTYQPLSTLVAGNSAMSGTLVALSGLVLTVLVAMAAPLVTVQRQLARAAELAPGYASAGLWTWRIRIPDDASDDFKLRPFAEQLAAWRQRHPQIEAITFMDRGPWSFNGFEGVRGPVGVGFNVGPDVAKTLQLAQLRGRDFTVQDLPGRAVAVQRVAPSMASLLFRGVETIAELDGLQVDPLNSGAPPQLVLSAGRDGELQDFEVIARLRAGMLPAADLQADLLRLLPSGSVSSPALAVSHLLAERVRPLANLQSISALFLIGGGALLVLLGAVIFASQAAASRRQWGIRMALGSTASHAIAGWALRYGALTTVACGLGAVLGHLLVNAVARWVPGFAADASTGIWAAIGLLVLILAVGAVAMRWLVARTALVALLRAA